MDEHLSRKAEALDALKAILLRSSDPSEDLLEKVLIHQELIQNRDAVLGEDFYSILQSKARQMPEMVEIARRREQIECVQISKNTVCPISQKEVVVPYVGHCGHVLERKEAVRYLKNNPRAVCPHVGCNKEFVKK